MGTLAVLNASQLVTLTGPRRPRIGAEISQLAIIRDGGMLIRNGKIDIVGLSDEIEKKADDAEIIDAGRRVVLPGFVDAHTHLVFAGNRLDDFERRAHGETYEQIAAAGGGIWSTVEKTRAAGDVDLLAQAKKHAQWFLRCGTTGGLKPLSRRWSRAMTIVEPCGRITATSLRTTSSSPDALVAASLSAKEGEYASTSLCPTSCQTGRMTSCRPSF